MAKKVVIGGQNVDVLTVEIGKTSYIPEDVLDNLTVDEYNQLAQAWSDANEDKNGSSLGES